MIYCEYKRQSEQTISNLIGSLARQLLQQKAQIPDAIVHIYEHHRAKGTRPTLTDLSRMLQLTAESFSQAYIMIDALDELQNTDGVRSSLISKIHILQVAIPVQMMLTSRYDPSLGSAFERHSYLEIRAYPEDIRRYVSGHMVRLVECVLESPPLQEAITRTVVSSVDGMFVASNSDSERFTKNQYRFLLAQLHMDSLRDCFSVSDIEETLEKLPMGSDALTSAYDQAMQRIMDQRPNARSLALQALGWMTYSERLLSATELCHALAIKVGDAEFDDKRLINIKDVISVCAGLLIIDQETETIRLVHYTTEVYFKQHAELYFPHAQSSIAACCLTCVQYDILGRGWVWELLPERLHPDPCDSSVLRSFIRDQPFLKYASVFWASHLNRHGLDTARDMFLRFAKNDYRVSCVMQLIFFVTRTASIQRSPKEGQPFSIMHLLAFLGGNNLVSVLMNHGFHGHRKDCYDRTPLLWAITTGQKSIVKSLLPDGGFNVNHGDMAGLVKTLNEACHPLYERIARLLIAQNDIDIKLRGSSVQNSLSTAIIQDCSDFVALLLGRKDINMNARSFLDDTPLMVAALYALENIMYQLLRRGGIDVNATSSSHGSHSGSTALTIAARSGSIGIVETLLAAPAGGTDSREVGGQIPLAAAAEPGQYVRVEFAPPHGSFDFNKKDKNSHTSWFLTLLYGHETGMRMFLEVGEISDIGNGDRSSRQLLCNFTQRLEVDKAALMNVYYDMTLGLFETTMKEGSQRHSEEVKLDFE